jgi:hypothetical protein
MVAIAQAGAKVVAQAPLPSAVVVPTLTPSTYTVTVLPAWAVPFTVGVLLPVIPSVLLLPVSVAVLRPLTVGMGSWMAMLRVAVVLLVVPSLTVKLMVRVAVLAELAVSLYVTD